MEIIIKATMTSKNQITIPSKVRRDLQLKEGDMITFTEETGRYLIEKAGSKLLCPICNGAAMINADSDLPCFYCDSLGFVTTHRILEYIPKLIANQRNYQLLLSYSTFDVHTGSSLTFPEIQIISMKYPVHVIEKAQDSLQYELIVENTSISLGNIDEALSLMKTEYGHNLILDFLSSFDMGNE